MVLCEKQGPPQPYGLFRTIQGVPVPQGQAVAADAASDQALAPSLGRVIIVRNAD